MKLVNLTSGDVTVETPEGRITLRLALIPLGRSGQALTWTQ